MSITVNSASVWCLQKVLLDTLICNSFLALKHTSFFWLLNSPAFTERPHSASPLKHPCFQLLRTIIHHLHSPVHPTLPICPPEHCNHNDGSQQQDEKEVVWQGTTAHADCNLVSYLFLVCCLSYLARRHNFPCKPQLLLMLQKHSLDNLSSLRKDQIVNLLDFCQNNDVPCFCACPLHDGFSAHAQTSAHLHHGFSASFVRLTCDLITHFVQLLPIIKGFYALVKFK